MITAALVTGNAVMFKPAEQTPGIALRLVEVLHEAGVPPGVLAFLPGVGEDVGASPRRAPAGGVRRVHRLQGGRPADHRGAATVRPGQRQVKRVIAEMGGKNPVVVDTDADLDVAVPAIAHSAFGYAGQKCSAASRVIVPRSGVRRARRAAGRRSGRRSGRAGPGAAHRRADRSSTPTRTSALRGTGRWRTRRATSSSSATTCPTAAGTSGPIGRRHRRRPVTARDRRDLRAGAHGAARPGLRPRDRPRQRHRLRAHRRCVLARSVTDRPCDAHGSGPGTCT